MKHGDVLRRAIEIKLHIEFLKAKLQDLAHDDQTTSRRAGACFGAGLPDAGYYRSASVGQDHVDAIMFATRWLWFLNHKVHCSR